MVQRCTLFAVLVSMLSLADKELQRKSLEDSLNSERSCGANRETKMQVCDVSPARCLHPVSHFSSLVFSWTGFAQRQPVTEGRDSETAGSDF